MAIRIRRPRVTLTVALSMALLSAISRTNAQQAAGTEHTFRRIVDQVNVDAKRLTATDEPIEGWMASRTVAHDVSNDVLARLKPGDQVTTNVSEGVLRAMTSLWFRRPDQLLCQAEPRAPVSDSKLWSRWHWSITRRQRRFKPISESLRGWRRRQASTPIPQSATTATRFVAVFQAAANNVGL